MLSNFDYYNSSGSDWSDSKSDRSSQPPLSQSSDRLDHDYIPAPKAQVIRHTIGQYLNRFDPLMESINTNDLFGGQLPDLSFDEELANAPTPHMPYNSGDYFDDLDDLFRGQSADDKHIDNNNNSFNFNVCNEVTITLDNIDGVNTELNTCPQSEVFMLSTHSPQSVPQTYDNTSQLVNEITVRKRHISYEDIDEDSEDDQSSVVTETYGQYRGKSKSGRKPSKNRCMSRNAVAARENREKKKQYVETIESQLTNALKKAESLDTTVRQQNNIIDDLKKENNYLKSIIENDSNIATLIKHMSNAPKLQLIGTHITPSAEQIIIKGEKGFNNTSDVLRKSSRIAAKAESTGICFHVFGDNKMSLELCSKCAESAKKHSKKSK